MEEKSVAYKVGELVATVVMYSILAINFIALIYGYYNIFFLIMDKPGFAVLVLLSVVGASTLTGSWSVFRKKENGEQSETGY
jgi:hypothetical protein